MRLMKNTSSSTILDDSTIVAIATPVGNGAISIVRLSGKEAYKIALSLTHRDLLKPRYAHLCCIYDRQDTAIDEALVLYFPAPYSYTTQDVCEVQCHGGITSARAIMQLCLEMGARIALAGEFTKRAFLGGRLDLAQAQAVASLIQSNSLEANKILMRQLRGDVGVFVELVRESLLEILAISEVNIDYSEEMDTDYKDDMLTRLERTESKLREVYEASIRQAPIIEGYTLAIVGKPNVGKSSLLNALLMRERAIVSSIEGTTRDTIEESLHINGALVRIVDTAGIRESDDEIERIGIQKTQEALQRSDIILALFDGSIPFDEQDKAVLEMLQSLDKNVLLVLNKSDLFQSCELNVFDNFFATHTKALLPAPLRVSIHNGEAHKITKALEGVVSTQSGHQSLILTSQHQLESLKGSLDSLNRAYALLASGELELLSYHIRDAIDSISHITRPYENAELLDKLFSAFCLGK